jgi:DNA-binding transcriptional MerR regulator
MKISELAARTGVSIHRLRRYEAAGLLRAERSDAGYRHFADSTVREVVFLQMGRELGLSLAVLAEALPRYRAGTLSLDELEDTQRALRKKLVDHIAWCEARRQSAQARNPGRKEKPR